MKIAVHAKVLSEKQPNGIGVYTYNLLKAISLIDKTNQYVLYSNEPIVQKIDAHNFSDKVINFPKFWSYLRFPLEFVNNRYDLLFVPSAMVPPVKRPKTVIVFYGFGEKTVSEDRFSWNTKAHFWIAANYAFKKADGIITISESAKRELIENYGVSSDKVTMTHLGYDKNLYMLCSDRMQLERIKKKYHIKNKYILNTTSLLWYRKNLVRLVKAFNAFKIKTGADWQLVITGRRGESFDEINACVSSLGLEGDVILTDYIPREDLPVLLSGAECMVYPSLHEGFGLSVLEAMACGCPVITSNISSLPEVIGDAGILVDPYSLDELAASMEKVLESGELREKMKKMGLARASTFSWEKTAESTLKAFEKTIGKA